MKNTADLHIVVLHYSRKYRGKITITQKYLQFNSIHECDDRLEFHFDSSSNDFRLCKNDSVGRNIALLNKDYHLFNVESLTITYIKCSTTETIGAKIWLKIEGK